MLCFFCDTKDDYKDLKIAESDNFIVRYDEAPISKGHCLLFPKYHVKSFFELKDGHIEELYKLIKVVKEIVDKEHNPDAYNIGINDGQAAGRSVDHFHMHLIPRYEGDVANSQGGVRNIIPGKGQYLDEWLATHPERKKYFKNN